MNKLYIALFLTAACMTKAWAWGGQFGNGSFGAYPSYGYSNYSPSIQPVPVCGNYGGYTTVNTYTSPLSGTSMSTYSGGFNGTSSTYTSPLTGNSTTTLLGY